MSIYYHSKNKLSTSSLYSNWRNSRLSQALINLSSKSESVSYSSLNSVKCGKKRHKEKNRLGRCLVGSGLAAVVIIVLWAILDFPRGTSGFVISRKGDNVLRKYDALLNPVNEKVDGDTDKVVHEKRDLKIQNTSDLHVDSHNDRALEDANNVKNAPGQDYLRKVVVFQKPFHFHIPIVAGDPKAKRTTTTEHGSHSPKPVVPARVKRDTETVMAQETEESKSDELDHLLKQHPRLVPSVNRKRSSGRGDKRGSQDGDDEDEAHANHLVGFSLAAEQDDDVFDQDEGHTGIERKRNVKNKKFSQDLIDSMLGHEDDLIKYRRKIKEHSKQIGVKPEDAFLKVVYGNGASEKNLTSTNDIYQRRLQFHKLFLEDSGEVEKYHYSEVVEEDGGNGRKEGPFNAYMKILKRSKRGLKSWLKKLFRRGDASTEPTTTTTTTTTEQSAKRNRKDAKGKKGKGIKIKEEKRRKFKEEVDENGDSQTDKLLPKGLRRSSYLKKKEEAKQVREEEEEIEEEEEKSREKEVKQRKKVEEDDDEDEEEEEEKGNEEDKKKEKKDEDDEEEEPEENNKKKEKEVDLDEEAEDDDKRKKKKKKKRHGREVDGGRRTIRNLSKDELVLLLEMIFNLVEYQCPGVKRDVMDGLLQITEGLVDMTGLKEYIVDRREGVDELFKELLECSSSTENIQRWGEYQNLRKRQEERNRVGGGFLRQTGFPKKEGWERPLRRTKRVRRTKDDDKKSVELISLQEVVGNQTVLEENEVTNGKEEILEVDRMKGLVRLYLLVYDIIGDTCFNLDGGLLKDSSLLFIEQLKGMMGRDEVKREVDKWSGHFEVDRAEKMLNECSEQEL